jgi:hypothetical protein
LINYLCKPAAENLEKTSGAVAEPAVHIMAKIAKALAVSAKELI